MLNALRKGAAGWLAKILLGLLIISFAVWGVDDMFRIRSPDYLATVGDRKISPEQFQRDYQNQVAMISNQLGRRLTSQEARAFGIGQRVLENLVGTTAIDIHADHLGLGMSRDAVIDAIHGEQAFEGSNGKFDSQRFQEVLRNAGLTEAGFLSLQREEMIRSQIIGPLSQGAYVPKTLLDAANHYRNDERVLKYFIVPSKAAGEVAPPDDATLKTYYDTNKTSYKAPEYRKIGLLPLTPDAIKDSITVSDEDVKTSYETTKDKYGTPERRTIQQLIFKDMASARDAAAKLAKGADFVAVGKELGMKEDDVNLGTFAKKDLADQKLADVAFRLTKDQVSEPIDSFSPVIVKVTEIMPGAQKSFEEVKDQVRDALAKERAAEELSKLYDSVEDQRAGGAKLSEIAKKLNIKYAEYTFDRGGVGQDGKPIPALAGNRPAVQLAFESDVGVENNAVTVGEGYAFIDVLEVIPERQKSFEEVQAAVKTAWTDEQTRKRARAKADELVEKAKGNGLDKAAAEIGAKMETTPPLKRDAQQQGLPRTAVSLGFTLAKDDIGAVQMDDRLSQAIIQVTEIKAAPPLDDKQAEVLRQELRRSLGVDILTQYVGGLQKTYGVSVNSSAISAAIGQE